MSPQCVCVCARDVRKGQGVKRFCAEGEPNAAVPCCAGGDGGTARRGREKGGADRRWRSGQEDDEPDPSLAAPLFRARPPDYMRERPLPLAQGASLLLGGSHKKGNHSMQNKYSKFADFGLECDLQSKCKPLMWLSLVKAVGLIGSSPPQKKFARMRPSSSSPPGAAAAHAAPPPRSQPPSSPRTTEVLMSSLMRPNSYGRQRGKKCLDPGIEAPHEQSIHNALTHFFCARARENSARCPPCHHQLFLFCPPPLTTAPSRAGPG